MALENIPIRRKLIVIILVTTVATVLLMRVLSLVYEFMMFRQTILRQLNTVGQVIAANSTAALAFSNRVDAEEILSALRKERHVAAGALYDSTGTLFAKYPVNAPDSSFSPVPEQAGYYYRQLSLIGFEPVVHEERFLGTLYIRLETGVLVRQWLQNAVGVGMAALALAVVVAYLISNALQKEISQPILALAETAKAISAHNDYSVRATKRGGDELGLLTDAFNHMLSRIQAQEMESKQAAARLRDSEQRYRLLFESSPLPMWLFDVESLGFLAVNAAAAKQYGYSQEEFQAMTVKDIRPPEDVPALLDDLSRTAHDLEDARQWRHRRKDGTLIDVEITSHHLQWLGRSAILVLINDITARKQAERELYQLNVELESRVKLRTAELEAANKELEAFSYSVSHDLRAPLRAVDGFSQAVLEDYGPQMPTEGRRYLQTIREGAQRMGALIDDLLTFSRLSRSTLSTQKVDSARLVDEALHELRAHREGRDIALHIGDLPPCQGDPALLKQVWINLLSNALKYTSKQQAPRIEIGSRREQDKVIYFVRDNGSGFDMQYADKLFGVFQRLHRAEEFPGTGVGLAIVQRVIHRHGGRVWAEGAVNGGAEFSFTLG